MAAFGDSLSSLNTQNQAFDVLFQGAKAFGYTPDNDLGQQGMLAAIVGSMLKDSVPFPAGTSAAPGVGFAGDADTGFFRVGANEIGVTVSGANVGGWTSSGAKLGHTSSTVLTKFVVYSVSLTPGAITNVSGVTEVTFAVTGLVTGDKIFANPPALTAGAAGQAAPLSFRVNATDVLVGVYLAFASVSSTPTAGTYKIVAFQS